MYPTVYSHAYTCAQGSVPSLPVAQVLLEQLLPTSPVVQEVELHLLRDVRDPRVPGVEPVKRVVCTVRRPTDPERAVSTVHEEVRRPLRQDVEEVGGAEDVGYGQTPFPCPNRHVDSWSGGFGVGGGPGILTTGTGGEYETTVKCFRVSVQPVIIRSSVQTLRHWE